MMSNWKEGNDGATRDGKPVRTIANGIEWRANGVNSARSSMRPGQRVVNVNKNDECNHG